MPATDFWDDLRRVRADYFANPTLNTDRPTAALLGALRAVPYALCAPAAG